MGEYEAAKKEPDAAGPGALPGFTDYAPPKRKAEPKLSHESAPIEQQGALEAGGIREAPAPTPDIVDETRDEDLHTASKLKALARPAEVVAARPIAGLAHVAASFAADPLHPLANSYYEPSEQQFANEQGALLRARGVQPGTEAFKEAFDEYKDRKWAQAHDKATAEGMPLTRMEYVPRDKVGWGVLKDTLGTAVDTAQAFAKGFINGRTMQGSKALTAGSDALTGRDEFGDDEAQLERHPWANLAGELKGASKGPLAEITKGATQWSRSASMGARIGGAAVGGLAAGEADNLSRSLATGAGDLAHGRGLESAKDQFTSHLLGSGLIGAGAGALGHTVAEGANAWQKAVINDHPELGQLRRGGGDTDILRGLKPGEDVGANIEAAREPLPGEDKVALGATPVEVAANKVREPLAQAHTDLNAKTFERLGTEKQAAIAADPNLEKPVAARKASQAVVDWIRSKVQPGGGYIPGMKLSTAQQTPGADVGEAQKLAVQLYQPRLVTSTEAQAAARAKGGYVVDVEEAKKMGFDVGAPLDETGVPPGAPPVDEGVSVPKILPKFPKGTEAGAVAHDVSPEEAAAIQRYTWGKRQPGDVDLVNNYLERAPATPLPHVYRGIAMKPEQAQDMLASGSFSTGDAPASVSSDPTVARSFAARNRNAGDVGITLKLEGASARNITPLAHEQVGGAEKELLLPAGKRFEIVSKHPDPANPGDWIVVAKEAAPEAPAGASTEEVFGRPADQVASSPVDRLKPRLGRAKATPVPTPGSDWDRPAYDKAGFDFIYHDTEVKDPFPAPKGDDITPTRPSNSPPMVERRAVSRGAPSSAPPELRSPPAAASPQAAQAEAAGVPSDHFKVVLEPREYNAQKFEDILGDIDRKAGYERANGKVDPQWEKLAQAIREDRKQFGPGWTDLIGKHHEQLNALEQRSFRAGLAEDKAYPEQSGNAQQRFQGKLEAFPGKADSSAALRELAANAPPGVLHDLEVLGAQNAYAKLKGQNSAKLSESLGGGGIGARIGGIGGALKFRSEALARGLAAGPTGESTIPKRLADYVQQQVPGPKWLPGAPRLGGGALGQKSAVAYNSWTEAQKRYLDELVNSYQEHQRQKALSGGKEQQQ